jgi:hypothetical protein
VGRDQHHEDQSTPAYAVSLIMVLLVTLMNELGKRWGDHRILDDLD